MQSKILLFVLSVAAFSSCSTAYKTGQTPDDVYYSPAKVVEQKKYNEPEQERYTVKNDYEITMGIRDRRWRDFRNDYEYDYSPYNYCYSKYTNHGYYYNPYYYPWAIYTSKVSAPVNTTPRMVNLNTYNGYNTRVAKGKTNGTNTFSNSSSQYNNSNRSSSRIGNILRQTIEPTSASPSSNSSRTYTPSSSNSSNGSSSSGSSSGSSSSSSRPPRGG